MVGNIKGIRGCCGQVGGKVQLNSWNTFVLLYFLYWLYVLCMFSSGDVCFGWSNILLFEKRVSKTKNWKILLWKMDFLIQKKKYFVKKKKGNGILVGEVPFL